MKKPILATVLLFATTISAWAVERFPPPDFSKEYKMPTIQSPPPRPDWLGFVDIGVLIIALLLATYFAVWKRSRKGLVSLSIFSLLYFGFYRHGCVCPIGAIQNAAQSIFGSGYIMPMVVSAFLLLPLIFSLFAGRVFCSSVCPLGALQELVLIKPLHLPLWLSQTLGIIPFIYLGLAVLLSATGSSYIICANDPFVSFFRFGGPQNMLILGAGFLLTGLFIGRPYCRFLCPYGALLRLISPFSKWRVNITPDECIKCRLCEDACPYGEIRTPNIEQSRLGTKEGRRRLIAILIILPVLIGAGAYIGRTSSRSLSMLNPDVAKARTLLSDNNTKNKSYSIQEAATFTRARKAEDLFLVGSTIFGGYLGLLFGAKLVSLNIRRRREDYEADLGGCIACGRCFASCPVGKADYQKQDVQQ